MGGSRKRTEALKLQICWEQPNIIAQIGVTTTDEAGECAITGEGASVGHVSLLSIGEKWKEFQAINGATMVNTGRSYTPASTSGGLDIDYSFLCTEIHAQ